MNNAWRKFGTGLLLALAAATVQAEWRTGPPTEQEQALDAAAFQGIDAVLAGQLTDVQSAVVVLRGRVVYAYYRDGNPDALRPTQSVAKSALSALVGTALAQGRIRSLDQPVVEMVPDWAAANPDPRAAVITVRQLLTMTAGFAVNDPAGTAPGLRPRDAWARPLAHAPGQALRLIRSHLFAAAQRRVAAGPR